MRVRALRGVCVGVAQHLQPGDTADLPAAEVSYLMSLKAVELVVDPPKTVPETDLPAKSGKKEK